MAGSTAFGWEVGGGGARHHDRRMWWSTASLPGSQEAGREEGTGIEIYSSGAFPSHLFLPRRLDFLLGYSTVPGAGSRSREQPGSRGGYFGD